MTTLTTLQRYRISMHGSSLLPWCIAHPTYGVVQRCESLPDAMKAVSRLISIWRPDEPYVPMRVAPDPRYWLYKGRLASEPWLEDVLVTLPRRLRYGLNALDVMHLSDLRRWLRRTRAHVVTRAMRKRTIINLQAALDVDAVRMALARYQHGKRHVAA